MKDNEEDAVELELTLIAFSVILESSLFSELKLVTKAQRSNWTYGEGYVFNRPVDADNAEDLISGFASVDLGVVRRRSSINVTQNFSFIIQAFKFIYKKRVSIYYTYGSYSILFTAPIPSPLFLIAGADLESNRNVTSATFLLPLIDSCTNCSETMKIGLLIAAKICGPFSSYSSFVAK